LLIRIVFLLKIIPLSRTENSKKKGGGVIVRIKIVRTILGNRKI